MIEQLSRVWNELLGKKEQPRHQLDTSAQALLASIVESSDDAIISKTLDGTITSWNKGAERIFGYTADEIVGESILCLIPKEREFEESKIQQMLKAGSRVDHFETVRICKNGTLLDVSVTISPLRDATGKIIGASKVLRDISDRVEAQKKGRLQAILFENLSDGVIACDTDGRIVTFNRVMREWHDEPPVNLPMTKWSDYFKLYEEDGQTPLRMEMVPLIRALRGEVLSGVKMATLDRKGNLRHLIARGGPMLDEKGTLCGAAIVLKDVTLQWEQEQVERRFQRLEALGALAAGVAHDLNNSLSPVMMSIDILRDHCIDQLDVLDTIEISARRGSDMVKQLLAFAKGTEGALVPVDLRQLLMEIRDVFGRTTPISIQFNISLPEEGAYILGDPTKIHQILMNLCVNARDAMVDGGLLTLRIGWQKIQGELPDCMPDSREGEFHTIHVKDTGLGMSRCVMDQIFDPFFTTKGPEKGTGLGLPTIVGILKGHSGFIQVQSEQGKGTEFTVYLPVYLQEYGGKKGASRAPSGEAAHGKKVLLVDDEEAILMVMERLLRKMGFEVMTALDGFAAIEILRDKKSRPDVIITDLRMPKISGRKFIAKTRSLLSHIPIVVASGYIDDVVRKELTGMGVGSFLDKPYTEADLLAAIAKAQELPRYPAVQGP